jgi:hypothetical protein
MCFVAALEVTLFYGGVSLTWYDLQTKLSIEPLRLLGGPTNHGVLPAMAQCRHHWQKIACQQCMFVSLAVCG